MWIKKIHIDDFGKFSNYDLELDSSFTVLHGHNEDGKSTLMAFIQMMFYGYAGKARDISDNPRKKFSPWNGKDMKGYILFEDQGVDYRLERHFGKSNTTDLVKVWNLDTGEERKMPARKDPGEVFFSLGSEAFERSVFIGQSGSIIQSKGKKDEITEKLLNMVTTGDENTSYQKVSLLLKTHEEQLVSRSKTIGIMDKLEVTLKELGQQLYQAGLDEDEKKTAQMKIETLKKQRKDMEEKKVEKDQILNLEGLYQQKKTLEKSLKKREDLNTLEKETKILQEKLYRDDVVLDEKFLENIEELRQEVKSIGEKIEERTERLQGLQLELENHLTLPDSKLKQVKEEQVETLRRNFNVIMEGKEQKSDLKDQLETLQRYRREKVQHDNILHEVKETNESLDHVEKDYAEEENNYKNLLQDVEIHLKQQENKENELRDLEKEKYQVEFSKQARKNEEEKAKQRHRERIQELEDQIKEAKTPTSFEVETTGKTLNPTNVIMGIALVALGIIFGFSINPAFYVISLLGVGLLAMSLKKNQKDRMVKTTVNETLVGSLEKKREDRQVEQQKEEDRLAKDIENLQKSLDETSLTIEDLKKEIDDLKTKNFELDKLKDEKREQVDTLNLKRINLTSKVENLNQNLKDKKDSLEAYSVKGDEETGKEWEATLHQLEEKGLKFQDKNQEIMDRYQVSSLEELVNVKYRYENFVARKESLNNDIDRVEQTLRDLEKANQATKTELIKKVSSFEPVDDLMLIPEKMNQLKELRQSLQDKRLALNFKIGELSEGEKSLTIEDITKEVRTIEGELQKEEMQVNDEIQEFQEEQFVEIKEEVGQLQEKMYSLGNTITKEESTLKEKYREKKNVSQIENEISALKNQLEGLRNEYEALVLAREVLDEAFIEIQRSFGPRLNETTAKIFSKLTNGKYQKLQVNREFDIIVEDEKEQSLREWKFLSAGTMDQAYLALRLSVATLLKADKENLPLFLDDIFMQYDDVRAYEALSFLQEYQKDSESNQQIILFTCHKRIMTWAKQDFPEIRLQQVI